jgi:xanthine dehydrogenase accessory factor
MSYHIYGEILRALEQGTGVVLQTKIKGERGTLAEGIQRSLLPLDRPAQGHEIAPQRVKEEGGSVFTEPVLPQERLIVLGGGHIALSLCEFATKCGFQVYVADDRPAFANHQRFPWAKGVVCDRFENAIQSFQLTPYDYVVVLTRGHTHDGDCLRQLLVGPWPTYLGMIGSRRRVRGLLNQLEEEGYSREKLNRICTPIGLKIGAVTPEEIAISILAELIAYKRVPEYDTEGNRFVNASDLEPWMVTYLAGNHDPKAIVTVLGTKGSTPRGAGAKMAVSPTGAITGSIGGGCSEAAVIREAIDMIGTGTYQILSIDMTGEVAESEGMVCGGLMDVLIEDGTECT